MSVIAEYPAFLAFYLLIAAVHVLTALFPKLGLLGIVNLLVHAAGLIVIFLAGGTLRDALLMLLFSVAALLAAAYFLPERRGGDKEGRA